MKKLIQTYRRRQLRKFAKTFKLEIQERFGKKAFYSAGEIEDVATSIGVSSKQREWAYGMFAEEPACQGFCLESARPEPQRSFDSFWQV